MVKISPELQKALNEQLKYEYQSQYLYLSMSNWLEGKNWHNASKFYKSQSDEEGMHAEKIVAYLNDVNVEIIYEDLKSPPTSYESVTALLEHSLKNEQSLTQHIYNTYDIAVTNKDYSALPLMLWFIAEQTEEEALFEEVLERRPYFKDNDLYWDHRMKTKDFGQDS